MYTTNGFTANTRFLRSDTVGCQWAKSSEMFSTGDRGFDDQRILCIVKGLYSPWRKDYRLLISDNYFTSNGDAIAEFEPTMEEGRTVQGITNLAPVKKYMVGAATAEGTDEMALYVSDDTVTWHRAIFPSDHKLEQDAYTILESTNYSIQVDVMNTKPMNPMGVMFSSNSNGTYFTRNIEHTNRNYMGYVDFEKMSGVQGIVLVNTVDNWEAVSESIWEEKNIKSSISFDDGRTFQSLKAGKKDLQLHSVTDISNTGRIFSSPAPGLVMGIGNTGDFLDKYEDGDLYVSDDAGLTWSKARDGPYKYEFGDQGSILVAIKDKTKGTTEEIEYSLDHGKTWKSVDLPEDVRPRQLTTTQDSTSLKFVLIATKDNGDEDSDYYVFSIDFDDMHERKCDKNDLEKWYARVDDEGEPTCLMGHKQYYMRRKADVDCFIKDEFNDPIAETETCTCTDADFECDYNFLRSDDRKECIKAGNLIVPQGECKAFDKDSSFKGSSGWRLIPGNDCKREKGPQKDDLKEWKCSEAFGDPASGEISHAQAAFRGDAFLDKIYLERTSSGHGLDETIIMRTDKKYIFLSHDHGKTWEEILKDVTIQAIYPHPYFNDVIYFLTNYGTVYYSTDRGLNIRSFDAPLDPTEDSIPVMNFHPKHKDWIIWIGAKDCGGLFNDKGDCHNVASVTTDRGDQWKTMQRYVKKCEFIRSDERDENLDRLIYCEAYEREDSKSDNSLQLVSSTDFFTERTVHFKDIIDFATMSEFLVVAARDPEEDSLKLDASVDGRIFADAQFPVNLKVDHQQAYTVLDSSTHAIFLHVTVDNSDGFEYGTLIKSNSNGTSYVLSLNGVNRDSTGFVDFEKMRGLEGVALVNIASNIRDKNAGAKKLKSAITHNDGAEWSFLPAPAKDSDGKNFGCSGPLETCSLHIHGYTERKMKNHIFSSESAIGLMVGVGNVGEYLGAYREADTFITTDGGVSWKEAKKGTYMWEYGDQGSIVVIVKENAPTNVVYYSLDEGATWKEYKFSEEQITIDDLTTVPSDTSRNFLLWGRSDDGITTINLDFSGLTDRQCNLDETDADGEDGDYYLWTPKHPKQDDDCLFGHVSQYHRKKVDADCYNGRIIPKLHNIARNCSCTRQDFEWYVSNSLTPFFLIA